MSKVEFQGEEYRVLVQTSPPRGARAKLPVGVAILVPLLKLQKLVCKYIQCNALTNAMNITLKVSQHKL
jgi:hypothetical protein